jgi:hypothetical protein
MGIKFPCAHCGQRLNIKSDLAGKRGICPHCHAKIEIPTESVPRVKSPTTWAKAPTNASPAGGEKVPGVDDSDSSTFDPAIPRTIPSVAAAIPQVAASAATKGPTPKIADPIDEAPTLRWYVMPEGATQQYGPAPGDVMRGWLEDGRVGIDSLVWREDWPDWLDAVKVFPQLIKTAPQTVVPATPAAAPLAAANPSPVVTPQVRPTVAPVVAAGGSIQPARPTGAGGGIPPNLAATSATPAAVTGQPNAPLFKIDEPVRHIGPAHEYVPSSKKPKTGSLIAIVVLVVAMLILVPVVIWVLTRQ